jgi:hypothetical protein
MLIPKIAVMRSSRCPYRVSSLRGNFPRTGRSTRAADQAMFRQKNRDCDAILHAKRTELCRPTGTPMSKKYNSYDVIVVGAGMAGLAAARMLGESGRRVAVVEAVRGQRFSCLALRLSISSWTDVGLLDESGVPRSSTHSDGRLRHSLVAVYMRSRKTFGTHCQRRSDHVQCKTNERRETQHQEGGHGRKIKEDHQSSAQGDPHRPGQTGRQGRERAEGSRLMCPENPHGPQPDDVPEDERTGDEPNPSRKPPPAGGSPQKMRAAITR